jgi:hypothetical protein
MCPVARHQTGVIWDRLIFRQGDVDEFGYWVRSSRIRKYQIDAGSNGQDVPCREGNSRFGLIHVTNRQAAVSSLVQSPVKHGS